MFDCLFAFGCDRQVTVSQRSFDLKIEWGAPEICVHSGVNIFNMPIQDFPFMQWPLEYIDVNCVCCVVLY